MEHRWGKRVPLGIRVRLVGTPEPAWIRDATISSAFIVTNFMPPPLTQISIEVEQVLRDGSRRGTTMVAHVIRRDPAGIAVEWATLKPGFESLLAPGLTRPGTIRGEGRAIQTSVTPA